MSGGKPCVSLEEKQIVLGIAEFLNAQRLASTGPLNVAISLSALEAALAAKFGCQLPFNRERLLSLLESMISSRNRYLKTLAKGGPLVQFVLVTDAPQIQPLVAIQLSRPRRVSAQPSVEERPGPDTEGLIPCFAGRVRFQGIDIRSDRWPPGLMLVPEFLNQHERGKLRMSLASGGAVPSASIQCLGQLLAARGFLGSPPGSIDVVRTGPESKASNVSSTNGQDLALLTLGSETSLRLRMRGAQLIDVPLMPGALLCLSRNMAEWSAEVAAPKSGEQVSVLFGA